MAFFFSCYGSIKVEDFVMRKIYGKPEIAEQKIRDAKIEKETERLRRKYGDDGTTTYWQRYRKRVSGRLIPLLYVGTFGAVGGSIGQHLGFSFNSSCNVGLALGVIAAVLVSMVRDRN